MVEGLSIIKVKGLVSGRVQGVGFRYFVRRKAMALGISGSAINMRDGRVQVIAVGERDAIKYLKESVAKGPTLSSVDEVEWESIDDDVPKGFVIG